MNKDNHRVEAVVDPATGYIDINSRFIYQYPLVREYLNKKINGWNLGDFMYDLGAKNIALYALTEFAKLAITDIKHSTKHVQIRFISDKKIQSAGSKIDDIEIISKEMLVKEYMNGNLDKILICSVFYANEIFNELLEEGIKLDDLISITAAVCSPDGERI